MDIKMTSEFRSRQTVSTASKRTAKEAKGNGSAGSSKNTQNTQNIPNHQNSLKADTFERTDSRIFGDTMLSGSEDGLYLDGPIPSSGSLTYFDPIEHDGIDWERLEQEFFGNRQVTLDNADSLMGNVDHMVSMYVSVKSTLEQKFGDQEEVLAEKMDRLNGLLDRAKRQITSSYGSTVGRFYESMGNQGAAASMSSGLSAAIDRRIEEMEEIAGSMESFGGDTSYIHRQLVMEVWAFNQREGGNPSKGASEEEGTQYSLEDLEAAGMAAKVAANMNFGGLSLMSDAELGISLASRYMKLACLLGHTGASEKMSDMILGTFGTFLGRYSGNVLSGGGGAARAYEYALKGYESTGNMKEAIEESGRKYAGDSFFSDFRDFGNGNAMSLSTRYNLDLDQFMRGLAARGPWAVLASVSGTGRQGFSVSI